MPPNLLNMLFSWAALLALFAALATATSVDGNASSGGNPLFDLSVINDLLVNSSLIPTSNLSVADDPNHCGLFCTADQWDMQHLIHGPDGVHGLKSDPDCSVPARTCRRKRCMATSAIYICNDNYDRVQPSCADVAKMGMKIVSSCCSQIIHTGVSGQIFQDEEGWNVIVAYGNCNHGEYADFPGIGGPDDPWGPNGSCFL